ncbi:MAG: 6-phosphogluconolactonase [Hyphomonadaceae bacterium]
MTQLRAFASREALVAAAAQYIADALAGAVEQRGQACAALSGGSTPAPAYHALADMPLDWPRITFLLADERWVPPSDDASNEGMLRRALAPALAAGARLLPLYAPDVTLEDAATKADARYAGHAIDVAVMGMGADGHTASWFPHSPDLAAALDPESARTVIGVRAPGAAGSPERLTLTRAAVAKAKRALLLIAGAEKRAALEAAQCMSAPIAALLAAAPAEIFWAN